jgi:hypothetical protein
MFPYSVAPFIVNQSSTIIPERLTLPHRAFQSFQNVHQITSTSLIYNVFTPEKFPQSMIHHFIVRVEFVPVTAKSRSFTS